MKKPALKKRPAKKVAKTAKKPRSTNASAPAAADTLAGISTDAVLKATGKGWAEWLVVIDRHGGADMTHAQIAEMLHDTLGVGPWWGQMVTVGYEQARGRRVKHQKPGGYEISVSRTINISVEDAFDAWTDESRRREWLAEPRFAIRKATPHKYIRATWVDQKTELAVNFYAKGASKCQVAAQHGKITSATSAAAFKKMWAKHLDALKSHVESR